jgi:hypothetical protein
MLWDDVANNIIPTSLSSTVKNNIISYQKDKVRPIRLMYNCEVTDISEVADLDKSIMLGREFKFTANELVKIRSFGPDNVSTGSW